VHWEAPILWPGETVAILGGGPSLSPGQIQLVKSAGIRRIATNFAYTLDLEADVLCWGDTHWWFRHRADVDRHKGMKVTWRPTPEDKVVKFYQMQHAKAPPSISRNRRLIVGSNTGHGAINLAVHFGVKRILLLGFDMRTGSQHNWHNRHTRHANEERYRHVFLPEMGNSALELKALGIDVVNCTPNSAMKCFPIMTVEQALEAR
jgi:hypothetical protein